MIVIKDGLKYQKDGSTNSGASLKKRNIVLVIIKLWRMLLLESAYCKGELLTKRMRV